MGKSIREHLPRINLDAFEHVMLQLSLLLLTLTFARHKTAAWHSFAPTLHTLIWLQLCEPRFTPKTDSEQALNQHQNAILLLP